MHLFHIISKIKKGVHNWMTLGLEEEHPLRYGSLSEYNAALASDNLLALRSYCLSSFPILVIFMISNWILSVISLLATLPICLAAITRYVHPNN